MSLEGWEIETWFGDDAWRFAVFYKSAKLHVGPTSSFTTRNQALQAARRVVKGEVERRVRQPVRVEVEP